MRNLIEMLQGVEERLNDLTLIHPYIIFFFNIYSYFSGEEIIGKSFSRRVDILKQQRRWREG